MTVLFTRLENKEMKISIKPFKNRKNVYLHVVFLIKKALINLTQQDLKIPAGL